MISIIIEIYSNPIHAAILTILIFIFIGLISNLMDKNKNKECSNYLSDYQSVFIRWRDSEMKDEEAYNRLITGVSKAQTLLGMGGIISFRPPFENYIVKQYYILQNAIPEMYKWRNDPLMREKISYQYVDLVRNALLCAIGSYSDEIDEIRKNMMNPIKLLLEGVSCVVRIPFFILYGCSLISEQQYHSIASSLFVKIGSFFTFLSTIIGVTTGWSQFYEIILQFIKVISKNN